MLYFIIVLSIPVYGISLWTLIDPKESMMFGNRRRYNGTPEFSDSQILHWRINAVIGMIIMTLLIIVNIFA